MTRVGIVAALATEARALTQTPGHRGIPFALQDGTLLVVSGIGSTFAASAARALIEAGARALASFGLAGGLDPLLPAGTIFLPTEIISSEHMSFSTSAEWRKRVAAGLERFKPVGDGRLLTSKSAISAAAAKAAMFRDTGARAVDMESAAVAHLAALHALPFIAARVIVDTADDSLPESVMRASGSGELQLWRLVGALALAPTEIAGVLRLARRFRLAQRSLRAIARADSLREAMA